MNNTVSEEITFSDLISIIKGWFKYLLSKLLIILLIGILGVVLGFFYAKFKKPVYSATLTFVLEQSDGGGGGLGQYAGLASVMGIDLGGSGGGVFNGDNILELYKSRSMIEKALLTSVEFKDKNQLLIDRYINSNELRKKWQKYPELEGISFTDTTKFTIKHDSLITDIIDNINKNVLSVGKPDKKLNIVKVVVTDQDQLFAKAFTETIVATVNNFYVQTTTKKSQNNLNILMRQTDSVRRVMNGSIAKAAQTIDATPNLNMTRQSLRVPIQKSQFNAEANKAILQELVKNMELSKMSLMRETPLIQIIDKPVLPIHKTEISALKGMVLGGAIFSVLGSLFLLIRRRRNKAE